LARKFFPAGAFFSQGKRSPRGYGGEERSDEAPEPRNEHC